jgi:hypothetical protein
LLKDFGTHSLLPARSKRSNIDCYLEWRECLQLWQFQFEFRVSRRIFCVCAWKYGNNFLSIHLRWVRNRH